MTDDDQDAVRLKFAHANVGYVLDGLETATVRYDHDHDFQEGDTLELATPDGTVFATATVTSAVTVPVRHAYQSLTSMGADHPSTSATDLLDRLNDHYDDQVDLDDDEVQVVGFVQPARADEGETDLAQTIRDYRDHVQDQVVPDEDHMDSVVSARDVSQNLTDILDAHDATAGGLTLVVEYRQRFTVQPPDDLTDPVHARDWFFNIYPDLGRDILDPRQKDHYEVLAVQPRGGRWD
jgi:uncharacterized protein YqfB (UPF0267 family)